MPGLRYYPDSEPGISRRKHGRGFSYKAADGTSIDCNTERKRLNALAVPPAYRDVWMSPLVNGHLQATGKDDRARKQYRYHDDWTTEQARRKFDQLVAFGQVLPRIRNKVAQDLQLDAGDKQFAVACAIAMVDRFALRVGNEDYTKQNGSYGTVTLRDRHVTLNGDKIALRYKAKGGKQVRKQMADRTLARVLHKVGELPGATLLTWLDDSGAAQTLGSSDLNGYLTDIAGIDGVTTKTFRTWAGSVAAFEVAEAAPSTIKTIAEAAAHRLHNTPTIARNSYIHPDIIDLAGEDVAFETPTTPSGLRAVERRMIGYLS